MSLFTSRTDKEKLSMFKDLVGVASRDGKLVPNELRLLGAMGKNMGLTQKDIEKVLKKPESIKFVVPKDNSEKIKHVLRLVHMMLVDGRIDKRENDFCISVAVNMGLQPSIVSDLVHKYIADVQTTLAKTQIVRTRPITRTGLDREIEQFLQGRC